MRDIIIKRLKEEGVKVTPQRIAVIDFLEKNKIHPSAEDIYEYIVKTYPTISLATIYNTLDKLEEIGKVKKIKIADDNRVNYEYDLSNHQHFFCKKCKKIFDINNENFCYDLNNIDGHKVEETYIYFKGICKNCL